MMWYRNEWRDENWQRVLVNIWRLRGDTQELTPWLEREQIEQRIRSRIRDWRKRGVPDHITRGACIGSAISHGMPRDVATRYTNWRLKQ